MNRLVADSTKSVVVLINDFNPEFGVAIEKLSTRLKRPLKGVILLDAKVLEAGKNKPDTSGKCETIVCDFSHIKSLSDAINPLNDKILCVASSSERNQPYLKKALPHMPYVHGPSESSLDWSTHKATMRELMRSYGDSLAPKSETVHENSEEDIQRVLAHLQFPLIVKPNGLAASILVNKAHNEAELRTYLTESFDVIHKIYARDKGRGTPSMLTEEFMEGDMYSVDAYVNDKGQTWCLPLIKVTTAYSVGKEGFYSYRLDSYFDLGKEEEKQAQETASHAMLALGLRSSAAHIELFNTPNGWKIIELGPRAGGYRQDMYWLAYGIDHAYNELLVKIGLVPEVEAEMKAYSSCVNIYADQEGTITSIEGFDEAKKIPSVVRLSLWNKPGDLALNCGNGGKFIIDGVMHNTDREELERDVELVRNTIRINTEPIKE